MSPIYIFGFTVYLYWLLSGMGLFMISVSFCILMLLLWLNLPVFGEQPEFLFKTWGCHMNWKTFLHLDYVFLQDETNKNLNWLILKFGFHKVCSGKTFWPFSLSNFLPEDLNPNLLNMRIFIGCQTLSDHTSNWKLP